MSVVSLHPVRSSPGALSSVGRSQSFTSMSSSLDDVSLASTCSHQLHYYQEPAVLSIEELRLQLNSCFTCGVSWQEDHVSLDCVECGGYSLERPCPICDGHCSTIWKRDLTMSHACGKARWTGTCSLSQPRCSLIADEETPRLCSRMEKLAASS